MTDLRIVPDDEIAALEGLVSVPAVQGLDFTPEGLATLRQAGVEFFAVRALVDQGHLQAKDRAALKKLGKAAQAMCVAWESLPESLMEHAQRRLAEGVEITETEGFHGGGQVNTSATIVIAQQFLTAIFDGCDDLAKACNVMANEIGETLKRQRPNVESTNHFICLLDKAWTEGTKQKASTGAHQSFANFVDACFKAVGGPRQSLEAISKALRRANV